MPMKLSLALVAATVVALLLAPQHTVDATVFTVDSRLEYYEVDARLQDVARSVAIVAVKQGVRASTLVDMGAEYHTPLEFLQQRLNDQLCPDFRFADSPAMKTGYCTANLIAPDRVVTAGHCVNGLVGFCENLAFIFGWYATDSSVEPGSKHEKEDVYFCKVRVAFRIFLSFC
jgi:hypothetical protein